MIELSEFDDHMHAGKVLDAIILTHNGNERERPLGIVTATDQPKLRLGSPSVVCPWSKPSPLSINLHCGFIDDAGAPLGTRRTINTQSQPWTPVSTNSTSNRFSGTVAPLAHRRFSRMTSF